jgi:hypothetical protein
MLAAATGASLKELMGRLGHLSTRAAMIYQHATRDRDEAIAKALGGLMHQVRSEPADRAWRASEKSGCGPFVAHGSSQGRRWSQSGRR